MNPAQLELVRAFTDAGGSLWVDLVRAARLDGMTGAGCGITLTVLFFSLSLKVAAWRSEAIKEGTLDDAEKTGTGIILILSIAAVVIAGWRAVDNGVCIIDPEACAAWKLAGKAGS